MAKVKRVLTGIERYNSPLTGLILRNESRSFDEEVAAKLDELMYIDAMGNEIPYFSEGITRAENRRRKVVVVVEEEEEEEEEENEGEDGDEGEQGDEAEKPAAKPRTPRTKKAE
jgi:hypothetical protein